MSQPSSDREQGFTLIELLMAITISGIIISALALGFIATMNGTAGAHERFVASNGAHTLATYFTSDVQSANPSLVTTAAVDTGCSDPASGTNNVLRLQWSEMSTATKMTAFSVSYRTRQVGSEWQLVRYACSGWANLPTTPSSILSGAVPGASVMAHRIWDPTDLTYETKATVAGRKVALTTYSALASGETTPYSHTVSASMRTPALVPAVLGIDALDANPTNATTARWTVRFSDNVTGVDASDFTVASAGLTGAGLVSPTPVVQVDAKTYTVTANTGTGTTGTIGLNLMDNDSIMDADGDPLGDLGPNNGNFTGQVYTVDRVAPTVTVNQHASQADPGTSLPVRFTATFSEPIVAFDAAHVTRGGTATGTAVINVTGVSPTVYDIEVTGLTGDGTVSASVAANKVKDLAGNNNTASTSTDNTVNYQTPPLVTSINRTGSNPTSAATLGWTVTFNKSVTGVDASDFAVVSTGSVSGAGGITVTPVNPTTYTVTANRGTGTGTVGLNLNDDDSIVAGGVPLGGSGAGNANFTGEVYTIAGTISTVQLLGTSGAMSGRLDAGDQIVVTFSEAMNPNSFCSAWTGTGNKELKGTGPGSTTVTVTLADNDPAASGNDRITVTAGSCTFNFGSIKMASNSYVTGGNATFGGSGSNSSAIAWDAANNRLTITLGTAGGPGTRGIVGSTAPQYEAGSALRTSTGQAVNNSPFTLPSAVQF